MPLEDAVDIVETLVRKQGSNFENDAWDTIVDFFVNKVFNE